MYSTRVLYCKYRESARSIQPLIRALCLDRAIPHLNTVKRRRHGPVNRQCCLPAHGALTSASSSHPSTKKDPLHIATPCAQLGSSSLLPHPRSLLVPPSVHPQAKNTKREREKGGDPTKSKTSNTTTGCYLHQGTQYEREYRTRTTQTSPSRVTWARGTRTNRQTSRVASFRSSSPSAIVLLPTAASSASQHCAAGSGSTASPTHVDDASSTPPRTGLVAQALLCCVVSCRAFASNDTTAPGIATSARPPAVFCTQPDERLGHSQPASKPSQGSCCSPVRSSRLATWWFSFSTTHTTDCLFPTRPEVLDSSV